MTSIEIETKAHTILQRKEFDFGSCWLTLYVTAEPQLLTAFGNDLANLGAVNLKNDEGGFLYPKLPVASDARAISALVTNVESRASKFGVEVIAIDLDTSSEVKESTFQELVRY